MTANKDEMKIWYALANAYKKQVIARWYEDKDNRGKHYLEILIDPQGNEFIISIS